MRLSVRCWEFFASDVYNALKEKKNVLYPKFRKKVVERNVAEEVDTYGSKGEEK